MSFFDRKFENCLSGHHGWFASFVLNTYDKLMPQSIWVRHFKDLPKLTMYIMATLYQLAFWGIFLYFAVTSYYHGVRHSWLSFDKSSGDCDEIAAVITGQFRADYNGNWESSELFEASRAIYSAQFKSYSRGTSAFEADVAEIDAVVDATGNKVVN